MVTGRHCDGAPDRQHRLNALQAMHFLRQLRAAFHERIVIASPAMLCDEVAKLSEPLDTLDLKILAQLQSDASLHLEELAVRVNSSKSVCWRRIQRFKEEGIITGRVTILDPEKVGFGVTVLAFVRIDGRGDIKPAHIIENIRKVPEVVECHALMGDVDLCLKIVVPTIKDYELLLWERFSSMAGILDIRSSISLTRFISTTELPLQALAKRR